VGFALTGDFAGRLRVAEERLPRAALTVELRVVLVAPSLRLPVERDEAVRDAPLRAERPDAARPDVLRVVVAFGAVFRTLRAAAWRRGLAGLFGRLTSAKH
jgi:hypothetical protein